MAVREFSAAQDELEARFQPEFDRPMSEEEHGELLVDFVLERERIRSGLSEPGPEMDRCDRETLRRLAAPEALGPEHSFHEAVFRRLVTTPAEAVRYWDTAKILESDQQRARARKPRPGRQDSITAFINGLVAENPEISAEAVKRAFKRSTKFAVQDDEVRSYDNDVATMRLSNLPSRLSDARKRFRASRG